MHEAAIERIAGTFGVGEAGELGLEMTESGCRGRKPTVVEGFERWFERYFEQMLDLPA